MVSLSYFEDMAAGFHNPEIQKWKNDGKKVVGTLCSNIPEELLHAAGLLPVRVRAPGVQDTSRADAFLHEINCSYSRSVLESFMAGQMDFVDGLIVTNTCDHHLRLAGELKAKANQPVHYFQMYHTRTQGAKEWFVNEMNRMIDHIQQAYGIEISDAALTNSIDTYNQTRRLMTKLNELRKASVQVLSGADYMKIVLTGMSVPRDRFNDKLTELLKELADHHTFETPQKPRLMIMGGACDAYEFIQTIEDSGAWVVADDLCFGLRHYQGLIDKHTTDPLTAMADRYFNRAACPSVMDGFDHSYDILYNLIKERDVHGVIGARLKYCDHWAGACKMMRERLREDLGIPLLEIEREYSTTYSGQISTRLQAFLEMLGE